MSISIRKFLSIGFLIAGVAGFGLWSSPGRAFFLEGATGFATVVDQQTGLQSPGIYNFAVLDMHDGRFGDAWGTGLPYFDHYFRRGIDPLGNPSPALDAGARYLYLYQVSNNGPTEPFDAVAIAIVTDLREITSWGHFDMLSFADDDDQDGQSSVCSASNALGVADPFARPGQVSLIVSGPSVVSLRGPSATNLINPDSVMLTSQAVRANFNGPGPGVAPGRSTAIFGFTSNLPPTFREGRIIRRTP